jgi:hypothetical protein
MRLRDIFDLFTSAASPEHFPMPTRLLVARFERLDVAPALLDLSIDDLSERSTAPVTAVARNCML